MKYTKCIECNEKMIVQDEIELKPHDDRLGGVNIMFQDQTLTTNIIYDIKIKYRCINCECSFYHVIKNHKGLVKQSVEKIKVNIQ